MAKVTYALAMPNTFLNCGHSHKTIEAAKKCKMCWWGTKAVVYERDDIGGFRDSSGKFKMVTEVFDKKQNSVQRRGDETIIIRTEQKES